MIEEIRKDFHSIGNFHNRIRILSVLLSDRIKTLNDSVLSKEKKEKFVKDFLVIDEAIVEADKLIREIKKRLYN